MRSLSKQEFKEYVVKKAQEYLHNEAKGLNESKDIKESLDDQITPSFVKQFVSDLKKTSISLSFQEPLMNESKEVAPAEPARRFHVGTYENTGIELKDTLMETMYHYNRQKSITHGKDGSSTEAWERLVDYKKYSEDK